MAAGADAIEFDVGLSRDGVVLVSHDPELDPDLTRGPDGAWIDAPGPSLWHSTAAELLAYDIGRARAGSTVAQRFPHQIAVDGARIPSLAEVLRLAAGYGGWIDVELKTDPERPDRTAAPEVLVEAVLAVAAGHPRLALRSFDWRGLHAVARRRPDIPLTWLSEAGPPRPDWQDGLSGPAPACLAGRVGATWGPDHRGLTRAAIAQAHACDLRVVPWTVNDLDDMRRLIGWGVDGICTDEVALARRLIDGDAR